MDNSFSITDLKAVLRFPFATSRNKSNFFVGALLMVGGMFVPVLPTLAVYGYLAQIMRSAMKGEEPAMPEWGSFGALLKDGLRGAMISLIYALPGILTMLVAYAAYIGGIISSVASQRSSYYGDGLPDGFFSFYIWVGVFLIGLVIGMTLLILGLIPTPIALARFVAKDKFAAGFELRAITNTIRKDKLGYFVAWVVLMGLYYTSYMLFFLLYSTIIFCFVAFLALMPLAFYVLLIASVLFGRFYRENAPSEV